MGQEILYCHKCGHRLVTDDFTRGRAHTFNSRQYCSKCLPQDISTGRHQAIKERQEVSTASHRAIKERPRDISTASHRAIKDKPRDVSTASHRAIKDKPRDISTATHRAIKDKPGSRTRMRPGTTRSTRAVQPRSNLGLVILGVVGAAVVLIAIIVAVTSTKTVDPAPDSILKSAPPPLPDVIRPTPPKTDPNAAARQKEKTAVELTDLEEKVRNYLKTEQYGPALDLLSEAKKRRNVLEWTAPIDKRVQELEETLKQVYPPLREKGHVAQLRGAGADLQALRAKLVIWGRKELSDDFERMVAETIPHEPLPPGAVVLLQYPNPGRDGIKVLGVQKNDVLVASDHLDGVCIGFESPREILKIPSEGEIRIVYSTTSPALVTVLLRINRDGKTVPFNHWERNPVVGKPQLIKFPISSLQDWNNKTLTPGPGVQFIYFRQEDKAAVLTVHEFVIFKTKD